MVWGAVIAAGISILGSYYGSKSTKKAGRAAQQAAFANAADLRELAGLNADAYLRAGDVNADAIEVVGEANAQAVERSTQRNMYLYAIEADEQRRRLILTQQKTAGAIRARVGASGVQTNTGSPQHYLISEVKLGILERRYGDLKAYWSLRTMAEEGADRAGIIRLTAEQQAMVTRVNAEIQADMSLLDAERQATAIERGGDLAASTARSQAQGQLVGGFLQAGSTIASGYASGAFNNPYGSTGMNVYSNQFSAQAPFGAGASGRGGASLVAMNPYGAGG